MKIAFVAHNAFGAVSGGSSGHVGGIEKQTALMARWLTEHGHEVSVITWDEGQPDELRVDGVRVVKMCRRDAGVPGMRFFWPRWPSLVRAMRRVDADVYYQNGAEYVTGQVAAWCRANRRKFVYSVASDKDVDASCSILDSRRDRAFYRYGLANANLVIVQTPAQFESVRENFGADSVVLPMPCEGPDESLDTVADERRDEPFEVIWVGRIAAVKRLEMLIDVARECPYARFTVAGKPDGDPAYAEHVLRQLRGNSNVTYAGAIARADMPALYRRAKLLLCTSHYEGFPNTFLEAWSHGVPVVSTVDPGNLLSQQGLGIACEMTAESVVAALHAFHADTDRWRHASAKARDYFCRTHSIGSAMPRFESALAGVVANRED